MLQTKELDLTDLLYETVGWNYVTGLGEFDYSQEARDLQHECVMSEVEELRQALSDDDDVETLDAICDILFTAVYARFLSEPKPIDDCTVFDYIDSLELGSLPETYGITPNLFYQAVYKAADAEAYSEVVGLCLMTVLIFNIDLYNAYEEVLRSNYTKLPLFTEVDIEGELLKFERDGKYEDVVAEVYDELVVFRCKGGKGKVVKPSTFSEPYLEPYIYEYWVE